MPNDYYSDGADSMEDPEKETMDAKGDGEEKDSRDEATALIPKSVTGGKDFKPGDEIVLEVVAVHEDELEVKYASEKGGEEEKEKEPSMDRAQETNRSPMASMMD